MYVMREEYSKWLKIKKVQKLPKIKKVGNPTFFLIKQLEVEPKTPLYYFLLVRLPYACSDQSLPI